MRGGEAMWGARIIDLLRTLNHLRGLFRRILYGNDLIVLSVKNKGREVKLRQIFGEICLGKCFDAFVSIQSAGLHAPEPELIQNAFVTLSLPAYWLRKTAPARSL